MNKIQSYWVGGLLVVLIAASSGCRNRCQSVCPNGYAMSPTIAAPPTYSLQIPSANGGTPYYVPGAPNASTATLPSYLVDPNSRAPSPNVQNGWRPAGGGNLTGANIAPRNPVQATSTTFVNNNRTPSVSVPSNAQSVLASVNYASTRTDERLDRTRIPATDASNVRAPASFVNNGSFNQLARVQQAPTYPNTYNQTAAFNRPAPTVYNGTPYLAGNVNPAGSIYYGTPFATQARPTVLAQSSTSTSNGGSVGWRDREITASRGALNR